MPYCAALVLAMMTVPTAATQRLWSERDTVSAPYTTVPDFRALAKQLIPAVVSIQVEASVRVGTRAPGSQDPFDFFHRYFGGEIPHEFHNRGLGSGFVLDTHGLILTNYHVVEDAEDIEVTLAQPDGTEQRLNAKVLGVAPKYDVALLQTENDVHAGIAYLGDSSSTDIGDWVMAVGNPFGLSHSISVGIISAKERRDIAPSGRQGLYNFLQTDASINPGNSGGPLVNMRGEVIGINSAVNAGGSGIGFAIPINMVKELLPDLKAHGHYARSWIGIRIQSLSTLLAESYGLGNTRGALVTEVLEGSPASLGGIREGDVILSFNGKGLHSSSDLPLFASMAGVGKTVPVTIWRGQNEKMLTVKLTEFPEEAVAAAKAPPVGSRDLGLRVADLTPALQHELQSDKSQGVIIHEVDPGGLAAHSGMHTGDLVVSLNEAPMPTARAVADAVHNANSGKILRFKLEREGAALYLAIRKP